jgi:hypothetical protein
MSTPTRPLQFNKETTNHTPDPVVSILVHPTYQLRSGVEQMRLTRAEELDGGR